MITRYYFMRIEKKHKYDHGSYTQYTALYSLKSWLPNAEIAYTEALELIKSKLDKTIPGKVEVTAFNRV